MSEHRSPGRALLIVNPAAGERRSEKHDPDALGHCERILRDAGFTLDRVETGAESPTSADLARRAVEQGYLACIVAGGDGTLAQAAAVLLDTPVVLGILPFGTVMNIAHGLGLPLEPLEAARVIARGRVQRVDAGEVRGKIFFETAGVGLDAEIFGAARHAERGDWRRALRRGVRTLTQRSHRVSIKVDGREDRQRALQILVLNSPYYGFAIEVLPRVSMTDGLLDVAVFPRMGRWMLLRTFITAWRGGKPAARPVAYRGARIEIASDDPMAVHADGIAAGALPAAFVCRKGAISVFG